MFFSERAMKAFFYGCAVVLFSGALFTVSAAQDVRFSDSWKFYQGDVTGAQATSYNDASWGTVYLPHTVGLASVGGSPYMGYCWYRKTFTPGASMAGKKLFLEFQAAMQLAYVWVNGTLMLPTRGATGDTVTHRGGYVPFVLDITNSINSGSGNVIAVRLNNNSNPDFPPGNSGVDFKYWGGLYRDVYLQCTDSLHITYALYENIPGSGGVFVTYPSVSSSSATVQVNTHVLNEYGSAKSCMVTTTIVDSNGATVATNSTSATNLNAGASNSFRQSLTVSNPHLWHPNTPYCYKLKSQVYNGSTLVDTCTTTIGIRTIQFTKANGFLINGQHFYCRGADRHQDYPYIGNAAPASCQYRDALRLKEAGFDFVRTSHYVQSPAFIAACDKLGIMLMCSLPGWQHTSTATAFVNNSLTDIRNMIRCYRNDPAIILWETQHNESSDAQSYSISADTAAHQEYPGNQTYTCGEPTMSCSGDYGASYGYEVILSSAQHGARTCASTTSKPMVMSEYGDWEFSSGGQRSGRNNESTELRLSHNQIYSLSLNQKITTLGGDAVWTGLDYQSGGVVRSGAIDWARIPKFGAYAYRSQRDTGITIPGVNLGPMVYIANWWTSSSPLSVMVFSNCDSVALYLNGTIVKKQGPDAPQSDSTRYLKHPPFTFAVPSFTAGTLRADGLIGGTVRATHQVTTPGTAARVSVVIDTVNLPPLKADGSDIAFVYGSILDANGTLMPTATTSVTFTVTGPATLVTTTVGTSATVAAEAGIATVLLRAGTTGGQIIVTATASGLTNGSDTVTAVAPPTTGIIDPFRPTAAHPPAVAFAIRQKDGVLSVQVPYATAEELRAAKFTLCNAQGRLVGQWNLKQSSTLVNIKSLPHGVYFGQISKGTDRYVQKLAW